MPGPPFFPACGTLRTRNAQVPGSPTITASPVLKVISPSSTQATSSLWWCRWNVLLVPRGRDSSSSMMLSLVCSRRSLRSAKRTGADMSRCFPPPAGTTKLLLVAMRVSFPAARTGIVARQQKDHPVRTGWAGLRRGRPSLLGRRDVALVVEAHGHRRIALVARHGAPGAVAGALQATDAGVAALLDLRARHGFGDRRGRVAARAERVALHLLTRHGGAADRRTRLSMRDGSGEDQDGGEEGTIHCSLLLYSGDG